MKVDTFDISFLQEIVNSFTESFPEWTEESAKSYLEQACVLNKDLSYMVTENGKCLGAIFCKLGPDKKGKSIIIEALQVVKNFRNKGVGKKLLEKVSEEAKLIGADSVSMLAQQDTNSFAWYQKVGFKETGWVELSIDIDDFKLPK